MTIGELIYLAEENEHVKYRLIFIYRIGVVESRHDHKSNQGMVRRMDRMDSTETPYNF